MDEKFNTWYNNVKTEAIHGGNARQAWNHQRNKYRKIIEGLEARVRELELTVFNNTMAALAAKKEGKK